MFVLEVVLAVWVESVRNYRTVPKYCEKVFGSFRGLWIPLFIAHTLIRSEGLGRRRAHPATSMGLCLRSMTYNERLLSKWI